jgi:hypothetical protein
MATVLVCAIAGWQEHEGVALYRITLEIPLEGRTVNLDALDEYGPGTINYGRHLGLHLCSQRPCNGHGERNDTDEKRSVHVYT